MNTETIMDALKLLWLCGAFYLLAINIMSWG